MPSTDAVAPYAVVTLAELLAGATDLVPLVDTAGKSGATLERCSIAGEVRIVKYLDITEDWTMRAAGVPGGASLELWRRGILHDLPDCFEQPIIGVGLGRRVPDGPEVTALLMRDVSESLVPVDDEPVPLAHHLQFLDHMARLHATFWGAGERIDIVSPTDRYLELSPAMAAREAALGSDHLVPRLVGQGWPLFAEVAPVAAEVVLPLVHDPSPLLRALADTPQTLIHANFKLDNLGVTTEGRTAIFDWETSGRGAPTADLAWYLAINCRRLPQSKEDSIAAYRTSLEACGIVTDPWWERQLDLSLLGGLVHFGWEKAFGGLDAELLWWQGAALRAAPLLR
jgi:hypothetical protein